MIARHRETDAQPVEPDVAAKTVQHIARLERDAVQMRAWPATHPDDRPGSNGAVRQSNRTDHERAKMVTTAAMRASAAMMWSLSGAYTPNSGANSVVSVGERSSSVVVRRERLAYIGALFGSATITSCPSDSRWRATHPLSVLASRRMRARGRPPSTAVNRYRLVAMRRSVLVPSSALIAR